MKVARREKIKARDINDEKVDILEKTQGRGKIMENMAEGKAG